MTRSIDDQTLALAGIVQACLMVRELAHQGEAPESAMRASLSSVFQLEARDVPAVYGGANELGMGLRHLRKQLMGQTGKQDMEVTRHVLTLIQLASQLMTNNDIINTLRAGIQRLERAYREQGPLSKEVIEGLAHLYQHTISSLSPRVLVNGNPQQLNRPEVAQQIRAALLAGIRSAVLWHQCGGRRWRLLLKRRAFITACETQLRGGIRVVNEKA